MNLRNTRKKIAILQERGHQITWRYIEKTKKIYVDCIDNRVYTTATKSQTLARIYLNELIEGE